MQGPALRTLLPAVPQLLLPSLEADCCSPVLPVWLQWGHFHLGACPVPSMGLAQSRCSASVSREEAVPSPVRGGVQGAVLGGQAEWGGQEGVGQDPHC